MTSQHPSASDLELAAGDLIAERYEVVRSLGDEGDATVFEALDQASNERVRVLVARRQADARALTRYNEDLVRARALGHPGAVRPREIGVMAGGQVFVVSDFAEGVPFEAWLVGRGPLTSERAARLVAKLLEVLAEAHDASIIHRGVKPSALTLSGEGTAQERVHLGELGATLAVSGDFAAVNLNSSIRLGNPSYTAPELLAGDSATPAADVYSAGLILAELCLGRMVVDAPTVAKTIAAQMRLQADAVVAEMGDDPLAEVVRRALQRDPGARYADARAMLAGLREAEPSLAAAAPAMADAGETPVAGVAMAEALAGEAAVAATFEPAPAPRASTPQAQSAAEAEAASVPRGATPSGEVAIDREAALLARVTASREAVTAEERRGRGWLLVLLFVVALAAAAAAYFWPGAEESEVPPDPDERGEGYDLVVVDSGVAQHAPERDAGAASGELPAPARQMALPVGVGEPAEPAGPAGDEGSETAVAAVAEPEESEVEQAPAPPEERAAPSREEPASPPEEPTEPQEEPASAPQEEPAAPGEMAAVPVQPAVAAEPTGDEGAAPPDAEPAEAAQHYRLHVIITSDPSRARLRVGNDEVGRTPYEGTVESSEETLQASLGKRGHQRTFLTLDMTAGSIERHVVLAPLDASGGGDEGQDDDEGGETTGGNGNPFGTINRMGGD